MKRDRNTLWNFTVWSFQHHVLKSQKVAAFSWFVFSFFFFFWWKHSSGQCICFKSLLGAASKQRVLCSGLLRSNSSSWHNLSLWPFSCAGMDKSKHMSTGRQKCSVSPWGIRQEVSASVYFFVHPQVSPPSIWEVLKSLGKAKQTCCFTLCWSCGRSQVHGTSEDSSWSNQRSDWSGKYQ